MCSTLNVLMNPIDLDVNLSKLRLCVEANVFDKTLTVKHHAITIEIGYVALNQISITNKPIID